MEPQPKEVNVTKIEPFESLHPHANLDQLSSCDFYKMYVRALENQLHCFSNFSQLEHSIRFLHLHALRPIFPIDHFFFTFTQDVFEIRVMGSKGDVVKRISVPSPFKKFYDVFQSLSVVIDQYLDFLIDFKSKFSYVDIPAFDYIFGNGKSNMVNVIVHFLLSSSLSVAFQESSSYLGFPLSYYIAYAKLTFPSEANAKSVIDSTICFIQYLNSNKLTAFSPSGFSMDIATFYENVLLDSFVAQYGLSAIDNYIIRSAPITAYLDPDFKTDNKSYDDVCKKFEIVDHNIVRKDNIIVIDPDEKIIPLPPIMTGNQMVNIHQRWFNFHTVKEVLTKAQVILVAKHLSQILNAYFPMNTPYYKSEWSIQTSLAFDEIHLSFIYAYSRYRYIMKFGDQKLTTFYSLCHALIVFCNSIYYHILRGTFRYVGDDLLLDQYSYFQARAIASYVLKVVDQPDLAYSNVRHVIVWSYLLAITQVSFDKQKKNSDVSHLVAEDGLSMNHAVCGFVLRIHLMNQLCSGYQRIRLRELNLANDMFACATQFHRWLVTQDLMCAFHSQNWFFRQNEYFGQKRKDSVSLRYLFAVYARIASHGFQFEDFIKIYPRDYYPHDFADGNCSKCHKIQKGSAANNKLWDAGREYYKKKRELRQFSHVTKYMIENGKRGKEWKRGPLAD